jgi:hypothetical protein
MGKTDGQTKRTAGRTGWRQLMIAGRSAAPRIAGLQKQWQRNGAPMAELHFIKVAGGMLRPANQADSDAMQKIRNGAVVVGDFKQPRNPEYHRRYFALLNFAHDYWTPPDLEYKGVKAEKNFERFRKEVAVLAGHYTVTSDLKGSVKLEPKSISFAAMGELEFQTLYKDVFEILWNYVLSRQGLTREQVENTVLELLRFE